MSCLSLFRGQGNMRSPPSPRQGLRVLGLPSVAFHLEGFVRAGRSGLRGEAGLSLAGLVPLPQAAAALAKAGVVQASEHPFTPGQTWAGEPRREKYSTERHLNADTNHTKIITYVNEKYAHTHGEEKKKKAQTKINREKTPQLKEKVSQCLSSWLVNRGGLQPLRLCLP